MSELDPKVAEQHAKQQKHFDWDFARLKGYKLENWRRSYIERIFPDLGLPPKGPYRFLDVGVGGMGYTTIEACKLGCEAWGIDLSQMAIESSRRMAAEVLDAEQAARCHFDLGPAEKLPYPDGHFDGISCIAVLEHIVDDGAVLKELLRVCKKGGRVYLAVPHSFSKTPWPLAILNWVNDKFVGHLRHYSREGLAEQMAAHGGREVKTFYHAHLVKLWQFLRGFVDKSMADPDSATWWAYEKRDLDAWQDDKASMISMVFEKTT